MSTCILLLSTAVRTCMCMRTPGQDLGVSDAQAIFAAGGGGGDGERDVHYALFNH